MKKIRVLNSFIIGIVLTGCASIGVNSSPSYYDEATGDKKHYIKVSMNETNAFAPSTAASIVLNCKYRQHEVETQFSEATDVERMENSECRETMVNHDAGSGFGNAIIGGASVVGGSYLIGKGLGKSGDNFTTSNSNANDAENSENYINQIDRDYVEGSVTNIGSIDIIEP